MINSCHGFIFGCSADEFIHFTKLSSILKPVKKSYSLCYFLSTQKLWFFKCVVSIRSTMVNKVFDGDLQMTNLNAQPMRVTSVVPLRQPAIVTLRQVCYTKSALGVVSQQITVSNVYT
ncbi:hypothetical protein HID58_062422 [Brassica napus]|uniref:Uncharacterized protein n=1 Tax=Brassica napus TaxID=3708 RepID=A0ABQ8A2B5_BRANA|nr:hypothetical protein HID58_062422 [Brassica napus]